MRNTLKNPYLPVMEMPGVLLQNAGYSKQRANTYALITLLKEL